jgi:outer membrane protein assembly factor BamB
MVTSRRILILVPLILVSTGWLVSSTGLAVDWPQWRGPTLDGTSSETQLPRHWSRDQNVAWRLPLPERGAATPIVSGERIFLAGGESLEEGDGLWLWAVSRATGTVLWRQPLGGGNTLKRKHTMASPSPVTDGRMVWVLTGTGVLAAFSVDGKPGWRRDLQEDYGPFGLLWGYAASPLLHDGGLYIAVLHGFETDAPSYVLRIDPASGKTQWRTERPTGAQRESPDAYTTPTVWRRNGRDEIVVVGGDVVTGHDPATGVEQWRVGGLNPENSGAQRLVASPLVHGDTLFAFGKRGPALAIRDAPGSEDAAPTVAWTVDDSTDVPTPVAVGGYLFTVTDRGIAWCHEVTSGAVVWGPQRLQDGPYSASPVAADGVIYAINEAGATTVFWAGPEFEIIATNRLESYTLASPAISDGQIFLRTSEALYAIGKRRTQDPRTTSRE